MGMLVCVSYLSFTQWQNCEHMGKCNTDSNILDRCEKKANKKIPVLWSVSLVHKILWFGIQREEKVCVLTCLSHFLKITARVGLMVCINTLGQWSPYFENRSCLHIYPSSPQTREREKERETRNQAAEVIKTRHTNTNTLFSWSFPPPGDSLSF